MSLTPFEQLLPTRALGRGRGLAAWFWGIVGAVALCGVLVSIALMLDLWIHRGELPLRGDDVARAREFLVVPGLDDGIEFVTLTDQGLAPTVWRNRDTWWGRTLAWIYRTFPAPRTNRGAVAFLLIVGMGCALVRIAARARVRRAAEEYALQSASSLRSHLHRQTLRIGLGDLEGDRATRAQQLFVDEVNAVRDGLSDWITGLCRDIPTILALFLLAVLVDWRLSLICLLPLLGVWWFVDFEQKQGEARRQQAQLNAESAVRLLSAGLCQSRLVRGYAMEAFEQDRFHKNLNQFQSEVSAGRRRQSWSRRLARVAIAALAAMMLYFVGAAVLAHRLAPADAFLLLSSFLAATPSASVFGMLAASRKAVDKAGIPIYAFINEIPEVGQAVGAKFLEPLSRTIIFESVTARRGDRDVLKQLDLRIPAGKTTAIVSLDPLAPRTLGHLLPRFIEPQSGRVLYDSEDIAWGTLESLRAETLYVSGEDNCFSGTVLENITGGEGRYSVSDAADAAKLVHAHSFILRFPMGYETLIGERGERLEPGQAFRIALARAILRKPAVLVVEEPDSPLDDDTKAILDDTYQRISQNRTVIFLPHRLSTVRRCDLIVLLAEGKVAAIGSHAELLKSSEVYRHWEYVSFNAFRKKG
ncbi:Putative multidrug export ATP-binding/permease protein [Caulifigura coniformis]|uniref:Multidrug export ATP-binding/permease protein n=1 Tax=Caulifigura coniformis TaxID=2527983 RepID=A0A517SCT8_9PLAN|nr:ABC transporter ATP-binding protein [Caulifigura coniformis]QDT53938.1 Putative multidrug export ATP-binding/permease protein [Caulifigura coniformis]